MWFTIRFLICSYVLMTLLGTFIFATIDLPKLRASLTNFITTGVDQFPQDLTISWDGLKLTMDGATKYVLPFPKLPDAVDAPPKLLELNTSINEPQQISQTQSERSLVVIGAKTAYVAQPGGGWSDLPLTDLLDSNAFSITKANLTTDRQLYLDRLATTLRALPVLFIGFFFFVSFPFRILSVLLDTLLIFFMIKLSRLPLSLKKVAQISLHVTVAAELITVLTANFSNGLQMFSLAFWGYTFIIYWNLRHIKALTPTEAEGLSKE